MEDSPSHSEIILTKHNKRFISLRYWLLGRYYYKASEALTFAADYHQGKRKDGVTPEFDHQLHICHYLRSLEGNLLYPEDTFTVALLHDVSEDYSVPFSDLASRFGKRIGSTVRRLSKKPGTRGEALAQHFSGLAYDPIGSNIKGADRNHNIQTMIGVFTQPKQVEYIDEAEAHILPMLKRARRIIPQQEPAYENIKHVLVSQIQLIRAIHAAASDENNSEA